MNPFPKLDGSTNKIESFPMYKWKQARKNKTTNKERSVFMKKQPMDEQVATTPGNAKHESRQVKKKNGDNSMKKK